MKKAGYHVLRYHFLLIVLFVVVCACTSRQPGPDYFGETPPGSYPELFAPGVVNTEEVEINIVINHSYDEAFFTRIIDGKFVIHHAQKKDEVWESPKPIRLFEDTQSPSVAIDPSITQDGKTMYFLGVSPEDRANRRPPDIYRSEKVDGSWQMASKVPPPISTVEYAESYPVVVADGSLYFQSNRPGGFGRRDTYRAQYLGNGQFETPVNVGPPVNSAENARSTYVSPDEQYLITSGIAGDVGFSIFRKVDDEWQAPTTLELGQAFVEDWMYCCPYMTPDQQYFIYSRRLSDPPGRGWPDVIKGEVLWVKVGDIISE